MDRKPCSGISVQNRADRCIPAQDGYSIHRDIDAWGICELEVTDSLPTNKAIPVHLITIGDHIRSKRIANGQTQSETASIINVTTDTVTGWELNRCIPQTQHIPKVIDYLGYVPFEIPLATFAEKVKALRTLTGYSQRNLGKHLSVDPSTIEGWEAEKHIPSKRLAAIVERELAKYLKLVSVTDPSI